MTHECDHRCAPEAGRAAPADLCDVKFKVRDYDLLSIDCNCQYSWPRMTIVWTGPTIAGNNKHLQLPRAVAQSQVPVSGRQNSMCAPLRWVRSSSLNHFTVLSTGMELHQCLQSHYLRHNPLENSCVTTWKQAISPHVPNSARSQILLRQVHICTVQPEGKNHTHASSIPS